MAFDFVDDHQPRVVVDFDGSTPRRSRAAWRGWLLLDGQLDVLRIVIQPADDDQILEPAGDEQFAVLEEAQVAGAQERPLARVGQIGRGRCVRFRRGGCQ